MSPTIVGIIVFACTLGGALAGIWLRTILPAHHLSDESRHTVKLGIGLIATMTALILGLVTASAKSSFDAMDTAVKNTSMDVLALDRLLARYGPETNEIRGAMRRAVASRIDMMWPPNSSRPAVLDPIGSGAGPGVERLVGTIQALMPRDDSQRWLQSRAADLAEEILQARWLAAAGVGASVPRPFLAILLFWLTITFVSYGLFAPRNGTVLATFVVCALSVGSAVFLILELDGPFHGVLKVPQDPLRYALTQLIH